MRLTCKFALAMLSLWFAVAAFAAQSPSTTGVDYGDTALVSPEQGQAVADFALQSGRRVRPKPDCSHLVHLLYARAGLIYPYEDSRVLYRGVDDFERVKTPQPGDLVVWLGHVGIVLSPEEKTFLSSVRSGIITESWIAPHWARRGRPRFLRYRIGPSANLTLLAAIMDEGPAVRTEDIRTASVQNQDSRSEAARNDDAQDADAPASDARAPRTRHDASAPQEGPRETATQDSATDSTVFVAMLRQRQTPSKREILAAILESSKLRAQELTAVRTLNLEHPVSVFDRVEISKMKVKHESGSFTLNLSEVVSQEEGRVLAARVIERELSISRRRDGVWIISDPRRRTYLPQTQALAVFEYQAETFLRRAPNSSATRAVVKTLDRLYDQQPGASQRAAR
jgi:NlpC/P60 family